MIARPDLLEPRQVLAMNLEFTRGRHGASARVEVHERPSGRVGLLVLRGWVDLAAERRIEQTLDDLVLRGVHQLLVDCSQLRHLDYRLAPRLVGALARFETRAGAYVLCGLSRYLGDLFRLAGYDAQLRCWPTTADLLEPTPSESTGECAS